MQVDRCFFPTTRRSLAEGRPPSLSARPYLFWLTIFTFVGARTCPITASRARSTCSGAVTSGARRCAPCARVRQLRFSAGIYVSQHQLKQVLWCSLVEPTPCVPRRSLWQQFSPPRKKTPRLQPGRQWRASRAMPCEGEVAATLRGGGNFCHGNGLGAPQGWFN